MSERFCKASAISDDSQILNVYWARHALSALQTRMSRQAALLQPGQGPELVAWVMNDGTWITRAVPTGRLSPFKKCVSFSSSRHLLTAPHLQGYTSRQAIYILHTAKASLIFVS